MTIKVAGFRRKPRFEADFRKLDASLQAEVASALKLLQSNPQSRSLRLERLQGYRNPNVWSIHITANHSHKLTFELEGEVAVLRRVATHRQIDRDA